MTVRSFPQRAAGCNANAAPDLYPSIEQRLVAALGESALGGGVKALANAFAVSDEAIYHRADMARCLPRSASASPHHDAATRIAVTPGGCRPRAFAGPKTKAAR